MLDAACIDRYPIVHLPLVSFSHFWSIVLVNTPVRNQQWTEHNLQKHAKINRTITNLAYNPALFAANEINKFAGLEEPLKLEWSIMTHVSDKKQTSFWWHTTFFFLAAYYITYKSLHHIIIYIYISYNIYIYIIYIYTCHEVYMTIHGIHQNSISHTLPGHCSSATWVEISPSGAKERQSSSDAGLFLTSNHLRYLYVMTYSTGEILCWDDATKTI